MATDYRAEYVKLRLAIMLHRDQHGDDRCWLDDLELYKALGDMVVADNTMPIRETFLANCARYYERRCSAGEWPTYQELETRLASFKAALTQARSFIGNQYQAELETQRICAELQALATLPATDCAHEEAYDAAFQLISQKQRQTCALLDLIDGLIK